MAGSNGCNYRHQHSHRLNRTEMKKDTGQFLVRLRLPNEPDRLPIKVKQAVLVGVSQIDDNGR